MRDGPDGKSTVNKSDQRIGVKFLGALVLPERHAEPNSHEHEGRPFVFWAEAGENVVPDLQHTGRKC